MLDKGEIIKVIRGGYISAKRHDLLNVYVHKSRTNKYILRLTQLMGFLIFYSLSLSYLYIHPLRGHSWASVPRI